MSLLNSQLSQPAAATTAIYILIFLLLVSLACIALYQGSSHDDYNSPSNNLFTPDSGKKTNQFERKKDEQEQVKKTTANRLTDELMSNIENAQMIVGGKDSYQKRGYQGETLSRARAINLNLENGYALSAALSDHLDKTKTSYKHLNTQIANLFDGDQNSAKIDYSKLTAEQIIQSFEKLNKETNKQITQFEQAWVTLSEQLDQLDNQHRDLLLQQIKLSEFPSLSSHFEWKIVQQEWTEETERLKERAFKLSSTDPVQASETLVPAIRERLAALKGLLDSTESVRSEHFPTLASLADKLHAHSLDSDWLHHSLREIELSTILCQKELTIEKQVGSVVTQLKEVLRLATVAEELEKTLESTIPKVVEDARSSIASATGIDKNEVLKNDNIEALIDNAELSLEGLKEALTGGDTKEAAEKHIQALKKTAEIKSVVENVEQAATNGQSQLNTLRANFSNFTKLEGKKIQDLATELKAINPAIVHPSLLDKIDHAETESKQLHQSFSKAEQFLSQGLFLQSVQLFKSIELKLAQLKDLADSVEKLRKDILALDQENEQNFKLVSERVSQTNAKMVNRFVSEDTNLHHKVINELFDELQQAVPQDSSDIRDPRALASKLHKATELLNSLEGSILMDQGLFELLDTKAKDIERILSKAEQHVNTAHVDGIPDSQRTTELIASVKQKVKAWDKFKPQLTETGAHWNKLSHELDLFLQSTEVIEISFESELSYAKKVSEALKDASHQLRQLAEWRGGHGQRIDLTEPSTTLHQGYVALSQGDYSKSVQLARQTDAEMRSQRHIAKSQDTQSQLKAASIDLEQLGEPTKSTGRLLTPPPQRRGPEPNPIDSFSKKQKEQDREEHSISLDELPTIEELS